MDAISSQSLQTHHLHHHGRAAASGSDVTKNFAGELQSILSGAQSGASGTASSDTATWLQSLLGDGVSAAQGPMDCSAVLDRLQQSLQQRLASYTQVATTAQAGVTASPQCA